MTYRVAGTSPIHENLIDEERELRNKGIVEQCALCKVTSGSMFLDIFISLYSA